MILQGDCRDVLPTLVAGSVQSAVTSPPYWGLRDYGVEGQFGLEPTPEEYVANMVAVFREVRRVLRPDGVLWLNLGDSYTSGGREWRAPNTNGMRSAANAVRMDNRVATPVGLKPKDLVGIPWRVAFALQADGWWLRSAVVWAKPAPMPESVRDRPTSSYEMVFLLAKSEAYYYDAEAIAEPAVYAGEARWDNGQNGHGGGESHAGQGSSTRKFKQDGHGRRHDGFNGRYFDGSDAPLTRNARNVWTIGTKPLKDAHFATMPPELARRCILSGSRLGDTILDPFAGAGTTGLVAQENHREFVGIELNPEYIAIAERRMAQSVLPLGAA